MFIVHWWQWRRERTPVLQETWEQVVEWIAGLGDNGYVEWVEDTFTGKRLEKADWAHDVFIREQTDLGWSKEEAERTWEGMKYVERREQELEAQGIPFLEAMDIISAELREQGK